MTSAMSSSQGRNESFASLFEQSAGAKGGQRHYRVGESVEVTIVAVAREAVFADLGGKQEGVFERPELSDAEGKLRVEVGSKVAAVVSGIDSGTGQVRLQPMVIRGAEADIGVARASAAGGAGAAGAAGPLLVEGARVKGKVTGIERYGVFVQISGTSGRSGRGLIPTPETATSRGSDLKKHFSVGQDVEAKILNIDETGRIRLSISALGADDERGLFEAYKSGHGEGPAGAGAGEGTANADPRASAKGGAKDKPKKPEPRGFGTLGDLLPKVAPKPERREVKAAPKADAGAAGKAAAKPVVRGSGREKR
jgi:small subunit ribosomal protein S1